MLSRTIVMADLCVPNEHRPSIERLSRFIEEYEPDQIVLVGTTVAVSDAAGPALIPTLHKLAATFERLRQVHDGPVGFHPGRKLAEAMDLERAPWFRRLDVAVLPTFHPIGYGWITTKGDPAGRNTYPGSKAIALARATGRNVVCGATGAQAVIAETAGRAGARRTLIGAEAGTLSASARSRGFAIVECDGESSKLTLVALVAQLRTSVHQWPANGA